jgi:hypothetical protein
MLTCSRIVRTAILAALLAVDAASASPVAYGFVATLESGALEGTTFNGSFAFDPAEGTGRGQDFLTLTALDFDLLGTRFTRADIDQGGQAILQDGHLLYFTAAFFPHSPTSPVSDIAFGFGGPGVIGYIPSGSGEIGLGTYVITPSPVPEASSLVLTALGALVLLAISCQPSLGGRTVHPATSNDNEESARPHTW